MVLSGGTFMVAGCGVLFVKKNSYLEPGDALFFAIIWYNDIKMLKCGTVI